jgi:hypothetical protein
MWPLLGKIAAREIIKHLQKKIIFVPIKYSGMSVQRGSRMINNIIATNCLINQKNLCSQVLLMNHVILVVMGARRKFIRGGGIMKSNTKKNTLKNVYSL